MHFFRPSLDMVYLSGCSIIEVGGFFLEKGGWYCLFFIIFVLFLCVCLNEGNINN